MRLRDPETVRQLVEVCEAYPEPDRLIADVAALGAVLRGHFRLLSGKHARYFLRFAQLGWHQQTCSRIARDVLAMARFEPGSVLVAAESAASLLAARLGDAGDLDLALCAVGPDRRPMRHLIQGAIEPGQPAILVADVCTTGVSLSVLEDLVREHRGEPRGVVCFAAFDPTALAERFPNLVWCLQPSWPTWDRPARCTACQEGDAPFPASELN